MRCLSVHHQHQHAPVALHRVGDFDVEEADGQFGGQGGDLGDHPDAVRDGNPHLDQSLRRGGIVAQGAPCGGGTAQDLQERGVVVVGDPPAHGHQGIDQEVERLHDGLGVVVADARPDGRLPGRDAGHVPEPAGGQLQEGGVLLAEVGGQGHQGGRCQVGHVGHHSYQRVVLARGQGHHVGAQVGQDIAEPGVCGRIGGRGGSQYPGGAHEQLARGPVQPHLLRPGHGVAPDELGMVDRRHQGTLHAPHVGDDRPGVPLGRGQDVEDHVCSHVDRCGHHHQVGPGVDALGGDRPELHGACGDALGRVHAAYVPAPLAEGQSHRAADQAGAEDHGAGGGRGPGPVDRPGPGPFGTGALSRGGRHGVPGRPRGRRGGCPPASDRWRRAS